MDKKMHNYGNVFDSYDNMFAIFINVKKLIANTVGNLDLDPFLTFPEICPKFFFYLYLLKKKKKMADWQPFWIFIVNLVMGYPCVRHNILFYIHGPVILHFLSTVLNIIKFKMAAKRSFWNCLISKVNQVIGWHSWTYLPN